MWQIYEFYLKSSRHLSFNATTNWGFDSFFGSFKGFTNCHNITFSQSAVNFTQSFDVNDNGKAHREDVKNSSCATELTDTAVDIIEQSDKSKPFLVVLNHLAQSYTDEAHELLQLSEDEVERYDYIADIKRRRVAAFVSKIDDSVSKIVESLKKKGILQKSIILFMSNGAAASDSGSNYPLRGVSLSWI